MLEIIIHAKKEEKELAVLENDELVEYYIENEEKERLEGNIYIGKVVNVLPGIQAAFVDLGEEKNAYIHVKDLIPSPDDIRGTKDVVLEELDIEKYIKQGQMILVQVKRDATNLKGARISTHISLPGRYVVLLPDANFITVSQKIADKKEKERLKQIAQKYLPEKMGMIIRTSSEGKSEEEIGKDIEKQVSLWKKIDKKQAKLQKENENIPQEVYQVEKMTGRLLKDLADVGLKKVSTNSKKVEDYVKKYLVQIEADEKIEVEKEDTEILEAKYKKQIERAFNRKIWLKCGGFITIDKTEALTAIDVNSGKFIGKESLSETIFKVNQEATVEIAKQLRLRDIGGIIVIDYIDMENEDDKQKILKELEKQIKKDRSKIQVVGFTPLDLLEITRKHMCSNLEKKEEETDANTI